MFITSASWDIILRLQIVLYPVNTKNRRSLARQTMVPKNLPSFSIQGDYAYLLSKPLFADVNEQKFERLLPRVPSEKWFTGQSFEKFSEVRVPPVTLCRKH